MFSLLDGDITIVSFIFPIPKRALDLPPSEESTRRLCTEGCECMRGPEETSAKS